MESRGSVIFTPFTSSLFLTINQSNTKQMYHVETDILYSVGIKDTERDIIDPENGRFKPFGK